MIELNTSLFFSKGTTRQCFLHPDNNDLCIKIPLVNEGKRNKGILKAVSRENKFYLRLQKRNASWAHLSQYKGDVETNLGKGSVYQLIRNDDGNIATNLEQYLQSKNPTMSNDVLADALDDLYAYMQANKILTTSLLPRNIVLHQQHGQMKLVIIDDIGSSEFIPVSQYISFFAEKKIKRKWAKFKAIIHTLQNT